jgi:hypothetical protein
MQLQVVGFSRSGSTLLYLMLRHTLVGHRMPDGERPMLREYAGNDEDVCTKRPLDAFQAQATLNTLPRPGVIITYRDPRDVLTSVHKAVPEDWFVDADHQYLLGKVNRKINPGLLSMWRALRALPHQNTFVVNYERLVRNPDDVQAHLARCFGLQFSGSFSDYHIDQAPGRLAIALNGQRPASVAGIGRWQRFPDRIRDQFTRFPELHDMMADLGYERDRSWLDRLAV